MKPILSNFAFVLAVVALTSCGSTQVRGGSVAGQAVPTSGRICYMPVPDGRERSGPEVAGSGATMTAAIRDELVARGFDAAPLQSDRLAAAGNEAHSLSCTMVLRASITEWEDNATEWSGKGDSIGLSAELFTVSDLRMVATSNVRKKASALAFVSRSPERFAQLIASDTVAKLFGLPMIEQ